MHGPRRAGVQIVPQRSMGEAGAISCWAWVWGRPCGTWHALARAAPPRPHQVEDLAVMQVCQPRRHIRRHAPAYEWQHYVWSVTDI